MQFSAISLKGIALGCFALAAQAVQLPPNIPDGVYTLSLDPSSNGETAITLIDVLDTTAIAARSSNPSNILEDRQTVVDVTCWGAAIDTAAKTVVATQLASQCGSRRAVQPRSALAFSAGGVVAFVCNFSTAVVYCQRDEAQSADSILDSQCPAQSGRIRAQTLGKDYGRANSGFSFCMP